jgi:hypothetical protein
MRTCPTCHNNYSDATEFCPRDGAHLAAQATETEAQLAAGLSRRFRIVRRLGEGGMGTVFLAEQIAVGHRPVALKILLRSLLDNPDFLRRFQDEAASTGRIHHPNVVTIYESGQADDGTPYIAMEFLEGESLRQALTRRGAPVNRREKAMNRQASCRVGIRAACSGSAELFLNSAACGLGNRRRAAESQTNVALPAYRVTHMSSQPERRL